MVAARVGSSGDDGDGQNPNVTDLLRRLNLTEEEEVVVEFSDAEEEDEPAPVEWAESI